MCPCVVSSTRSPVNNILSLSHIPMLVVKIADEMSLYFTRDMLPAFKDMTASAVKARLANVKSTSSVAYKGRAGKIYTYTLEDDFVGMSAGEKYRSRQ